MKRERERELLAKIITTKNIICVNGKIPKGRQRLQC